MNKALIAAIIAATALIPPAALAQDRNRGRQAEQQRPDSRQMRRDAREAYVDRQRSSQSQRRAAPAPAPAPAPVVQQRQAGGQEWRGSRPDNRQRPPVATPVAQQQQRQFNGQDRRGDRQDARRGQRADRQDYRQGQRGDRQDYRQGQRGDRQDYRQGQRGDRQDYRQGQRDNRNGYQSGRQVNREALTRGAQRRDDARYRNDNHNRSWQRNWRNDRRNSWRDYRAHNRNVYHLPRYYAPRGYGYGYQRFSVGLTIGSMLFSQNYWIDDPFYYRLPPAYGPYRWVRYFDDALLVDIRTGTVVDIEYDIFW